MPRQARRPKEVPLREMAGQRPFFPLVFLLGIALALISGLEWTIWIPVPLIYTLVPFKLSLQVRFKESGCDSNR